MKLVVDRREPWKLVEVLNSKTDHDASQDHLNTGDIVAPSLDAAVERKTLNDAVESVGNGRLFDQVTRMEDEFSHSMVLVHGQSVHNIRADAHGGHATAVRSVMGTLAHLQMETGTHAMWLPGDGTDNQGDFSMAQFVEYMERWYDKID